MTVKPAFLSVAPTYASTAAAGRRQKHAHALSGRRDSSGRR